MAAMERPKLTEAPESAALNYADDRTPGITRVRRGKGWSFHLPCGTRIGDKGEIKRLASIAMPPAYERCWFSIDPAGHIQATGYDARGRKQYRYHPAFRAGQDASKYALCAAFGEALPAMRARIEAVLTDRTPKNRAQRANAASPRSSACSTSAISASATNNTRRPTAASASPLCASATSMCTATRSS